MSTREADPMLAPAPPAIGHPPPSQRPLFRQEVVEWQRTGREWGRVVPLQPVVTRMSVWLILLCVASVIGFLFVGEYARKAVALGYLRPAAGSARVFVPQSGVVDRVLVVQGDHVTAGQPLFSVATDQITSNGQDVNATTLKSLHQQIQSLTQQAATEAERTESERARLKAQMASQQAELAQISAEVVIQTQRVRLTEEIVASGSALVKKGLVSELEQRRREDTVLEARRSLQNLLETMQARQGQLNDTRFTFEQLPFVKAEKLRSLKDGLAATEQRIAEIEGRRSYLVRAPIAGQVALLETSAGQMADPKRLQLEIVPENSSLRAEVFVSPRAIGLIQSGQTVRIRYDTFPYLKYGTYGGTVTQVSHTAISSADNLAIPVSLQEPSYRVTIALDREIVDLDGKRAPLEPDMLLRADIILEKHTLAGWILNALRMVE